MALFKHRTLPVTRHYEVRIGHAACADGACDFKTYASSRKTQPLRRGEKSLRVVHISDVHDCFHQIPGGSTALLDAVRATSPDLIGITGDLFDKHALTAPLVLELVEQLALIAPLFLVGGNHDQNPIGKDGKQLSYAYTRALAQESPEVLAGLPSLLTLHRTELLERSAYLLENQTVVFAPTDETDRRIVVCGLSDPWPMSAIDPATVRQRMVQTMDSARQLADGQSCPLVVLAHRPEYAKIYAACRADLVLSGHTHAGQVRLPLIGALSVPNQHRPFYDWGCFRLPHADKDFTTLIVSAGLGTSARSPRINCPPEIGVVDLSWSAEQES